MTIPDRVHPGHSSRPVGSLARVTQFERPDLRTMIESQYFIQECMFSKQGPDAIRTEGGICYDYLSTDVLKPIFEDSAEGPDLEQIDFYAICYQMVQVSSDPDAWEPNFDEMILMVFFKNAPEEEYPLARDDAYYIIGWNHLHKVQAKTSYGKYFIDVPEIREFAESLLT